MMCLPLIISSFNFQLAFADQLIPTVLCVLRNWVGDDREDVVEGFFGLGADLNRSTENEKVAVSF